MLNFKKFKILILAAFFFAATPYFYAQSFDGSGSGSIRRLGSSQPSSSIRRIPQVSQISVAQTQETNTQREWTVLLYMNGKNNLELYALNDFNAIEATGSTPEVAFVAELGRSERYETMDGDWYGSRRYYIEKDDNLRKIKSPVLYQNENSDMGSWKNLVDFVKWGKSNFPAKKYMLIIWNHGSGWKSNPRSASLPAGLSVDEEKGTHISIADLGKAFKQFGPIDVYAADACLMQMVSVNYEIKDYVKYIVASEDLEPSGGFNYEQLSEFLVKDPRYTPIYLAMQTVSTYIAYYAMPNKPVTMSVVDAQALGGLVAKTDALAQALMNTGDQRNIRMIARKTISFYESDYRDLRSFAQGVTALGNAEVNNAADDLIKYIDTRLVKFNGKVGSKYKNIGGISIYISVINYDKAYDDLAFAKIGKWAQFIKWLNTNLDRADQRYID